MTIFPSRRLDAA